MHLPEPLTPEQALAEAVMERELKSTISVSDAQVQQFYDTGADALVKIMQDELERLVKAPTSTPGQVAAVKEQVDLLRNGNLEKLQAEETIKVAHIFVPTRNRDTGEMDSDAEVKRKLFASMHAAAGQPTAASRGLALSR